MKDRPGSSRVSALILVAAIGFASGAAFFHGGDVAHAISFWGEKEQKAADTPAAAAIKPTPPSVAVQGATSLPDFATLAEHLSPSVVNISTTSQHEAPSGFGGMPQPFGQQDPHDFLGPFERFFGGPMPKHQFRQKSLGSGFIINNDGLILTNNHVIEDADEITVRLENGKEVDAKVIGRDPKTDIAVIKVDGAQGIEPVVMGDSDKLRVGEWVMAIGNPFGLDHTVTAGIVSAKGRYIGQGSYDDFIQTDAAINPGNSGGPLINLHGEVVGINSAIFSRTGGNIGIGFAIPINLAKELLPELQEKGKVTRGWLGVLIQKVTPEIAESLGLQEPHGALVADVMKGGPAEDGGIQVGDVIVEFDGHPVKESTELPMLVARTRVGKKVDVKVLRDKKPTMLQVTIQELKEEETAASSEESEDLGLTVQPLTPEIAESLGIEGDEKGMVITSVENGSPADEAGLRRGDVILEVNRKPVGDLGAYRKALHSSEKGKSILLWVRRGDNTIFVAVKPSH